MDTPTSHGRERRRPRVLYVDDQPGNLLVFKASLKKHVDVWTATSAREGLEIIVREEIPIVISDQKMDGMSGTEFLAEVRRRDPDIIRMLVTAYTNFDDVVAAINEGQVTRFISKPWEPQELISAIIAANELYWTLKENHALSEELIHKERLAAIGQVTAGLVHELGNILASLRVVDEVRAEIKRGGDPSRELDVLQSGVDRIMLLVESLRLYSKSSDVGLERRPVDLNGVVARAMMLARLFPAAKALRSCRFTPTGGTVLASVDPKKLEQVVLNVVKNAVESAPQGGEGEVRVTIEPVGTRAAIRVRDNGPGVPLDAAARIWDGFYTTKGDEGTGLGLLMCRKIMTAHGGSIDFENDPQGGCTFTITVPGAVFTTAAAQAPAPDHALAGG